jgi:hypothetical protein
VKYWFATRWAPYPDEDPDDFSFYLQEKKEPAVDGISVGDLVFVHQALGGQTKIIEKVGGGHMRMHCGKGKGGIVALCEVLSEPELTRPPRKFKYLDGERYWKVKVPLRTLNRSGHVPTRAAAALLGHSPNYTLRAFGKLNSGSQRDRRGQI